MHAYVCVIHRSVAYPTLSEISMLVYLEITIELNFYYKYQHLKSDEFMHLLLWSSLVWLHNEVEFYMLFPLKLSCRFLVIHYKCAALLSQPVMNYLGIVREMYYRCEIMIFPVLSVLEIHIRQIFP